MDADSFRCVVGEKWKDTATEQVCSSRFGRLVGLDGYKRTSSCDDGDHSRSGEGDGDGAVYRRHVAASSEVGIAGDGVRLQATSSDSSGAFTFYNVEVFWPFTVTAHHPATDRSHIVGKADEELAGEGETVTEEDGTPIDSTDVFILDSFAIELRSEGTMSVSVSAPSLWFPKERSRCGRR